MVPAVRASRIFTVYFTFVVREKGCFEHILEVFGGICILELIRKLVPEFKCTHDISNLGDRNSITPLLKADWYGPVS